jgi:hypothetical protein
MQNLLVQTVALVVAGVVLLIIANVNIRVQSAAISATQYQTAKTNQTDIVGLMDRDFRNIGSSYPNYLLNPEDAIISFDSSGTFAFWGQTGRGLPPDSIRYSWSQYGTVRVDTGYVPAYSIERSVNGQPAGGSAGAVTEFSLRLLDNDGNPAGVLSDTRQIDVELIMMSSLGSNELTDANRWETVIRPAALARDTL